MAQDSSKVWTVFSLLSAVGAAAVARKVLDRGWRTATGKTPPDNPADPDTQIGEAVAWAVVTGSVVAMARMLAQRRAAGYYQKSTGHLPPGVRKGDTA